MSGASAAQLAKRALVSVLLRLAAWYRLAALGVKRESEDKEVEAAFRKVVRRAHPDKGGTKERFQRLEEAYAVLSDPTRRRAYELLVAQYEQATGKGDKGGKGGSQGSGAAQGDLQIAALPGGQQFRLRHQPVR